MPILTWELPPRARRIPTCDFIPEPWQGTTSACAENTTVNSDVTVAIWNYLRVRGEYKIAPHKPLCQAELPPRARRILNLVVKPETIIGTTSACAENTDVYSVRDIITGNYLRVRGEYAG